MKLKHRKTGDLYNASIVGEIGDDLVHIGFNGESSGWVKKQEYFEENPRSFGFFEYEPTDWNEFNNEVALFRLK